MKKRYILPFLLLIFLFAYTPQAQAGPVLKSENTDVSGANRYDAEYYEEPALRFAAEPAAVFGADKERLSLEEYIVTALENYETLIDVSAYNIPRSQGSQEYLRILNDNPQLFYVRELVRTGCTTDQVITFQPYYLEEKEEAMQMKEELEIAVQKAMEQVDASMGAVQKALIVHDYLVQNCEYDQERFMAGNVPDISHTAYGPLVNGIAVCDGYAKAYAYIMEDKLEIPCTVISSNSMSHAWNMIEIDGEWYHVDLTWDDPVWDCIGRVEHNYFLLSDQAISQNSPDAATGNGNHYAWTKGYTADSDRYDQEFWTDVESAISYYNGAWYYSGYQPENRRVVLRKKNDLFGAGTETVYQTSPWQASGQGSYSASFMYLAQSKRRLYFNTQTAIMQMDEDGTIESFYEPDDLAGKQIFGFTVKENEFLYAPNHAHSTAKQSDIRSYTLTSIEGIAADHVTGVYNGNPYKIEIQGLTDGDLVQYALVNGADMKYRDMQPDMTNAGTYRVRYRVDREGYATHERTVTVTIAKAEAEYTVPQGCAGKSGGTLADIALPEGFTWRNPGTQLYQEGERAYLALYTPKDAVNYKSANVEIVVKVTCPGHVYTSKVTKQPTAQEEGIRTYTCKLCRNSYTETIAKKTNSGSSKEEDGDKTEPGKTVKDISGTASVTISAASCTYNGKPHTPVVSVWDGRTVLRKNRDYTVSYQNNIKIGTAAITVTGIGNYKGKIVKKFTIVPKGTGISGSIRTQKAALTVKWKKQKKNIDGYEIWCSAGAGFAKSTTVKKTAKKTAAKLTVKKLKARTGYYVKVRTYKKVNGKKYYSFWSGVRFARTR